MKVQVVQLRPVFHGQRCGNGKLEPFNYEYCDDGLLAVAGAPLVRACLRTNLCNVQQVLYFGTCRPLFRLALAFPSSHADTRGSRAAAITFFVLSSQCFVAHFHNALNAY